MVHLEEEDLKWRQRVKQHWFQYGDKNTRFFHMSASQRRNNNRIRKINNSNGVFHSTQAKVGALFYSFYAQLFYTSNLSRIDDCIQALNQCVTPTMN